MLEDHLSTPATMDQLLLVGTPLCSALYTDCVCSPSQLSGVCAASVPNLQMRKVRLRDSKSLALFFELLHRGGPGGAEDHYLL